tara:strand:+ start:1998 stop:2618 length:621 start_codon:yes stop_codon:yes gene_type:complete
MKVEEIKFLEIKKISDNYLSLGHYKNKPIIININNLEVNKEIYKEEEKLYIEIQDEEIKILSIIEDYICKHVYEMNDITIDYKIFKQQTFKSIYKKDYIKLEVHKNCLLLEEDQLENKKVIEVNELKKKNYINIKIHFIGIKFFSKKFEPIFTIRKIIKHIEDDVSVFTIESDEEDKIEDNTSILLNDEKITFLINENYPKTQIEI